MENFRCFVLLWGVWSYSSVHQDFVISPHKERNFFFFSKEELYEVTVQSSLSVLLPDLNCHGDHLFVKSLKLVCQNIMFRTTTLNFLMIKIYRFI